MTRISRRNLLAAAPAAAVLATAAAAPAASGAAHPDAAVFELCDEIRRLHAAMDAANAEHERAHELFAAEMGSEWSHRPSVALSDLASQKAAELPSKAIDALFGLVHKLAESESEADERYKLSALCTICNELYEEVFQAVDRLDETPARTLSGLSAKIDLWRWLDRPHAGDGETDITLARLDSLAQDLAALTANGAVRS